MDFIYLALDGQKASEEKIRKARELYRRRLQRLQRFMAGDSTINRLSCAGSQLAPWISDPHKVHHTTRKWGSHVN